MKRLIIILLLVFTFPLLAIAKNIPAIYDTYGGGKSSGLLFSYYSKEGKASIVENLKQILSQKGDILAIVFESWNFSFVSFWYVTLGEDGVYFWRRTNLENNQYPECSPSLMEKMSEEERTQNCYTSADKFIAYGPHDIGWMESQNIETVLDLLMEEAHQPYVCSELTDSYEKINSMDLKSHERKEFEELINHFLFAHFRDIKSLAGYVLQKAGWLMNAGDSSGWSRQFGIRPLQNILGDKVDVEIMEKFFSALNKLREENLAFASQHFDCPGVKRSESGKTGTLLNPGLLSQCKVEYVYGGDGDEKDYLYTAMESLGFKYDIAAKLWK